MRLQIRCKSLRLSEEMREQVRVRLAFALARFGHRIKDVTAKLADLNGRKGGIDKQCCLVVRLNPKGNVTIVQAASTVSAAIAQAADRAGHSVGHVLKRRRDAKINRAGFSPRHTEPSQQTAFSHNQEPRLSWRTFP